MGRKKLLPNRDSIILEAAALLFSVRGYEKTTLDEIAAQAGISKGSIYLEFPSKEEILYCLIQRSKDSELAEMQRIASQPGDALPLLKTLLVINIGAIYASVQRNQLTAEELRQNRKHLYEKIKPFVEARLALVQELLVRAEQQGEIRPLAKPGRTADLIMLALRGVRPPYCEETSLDSLERDAAGIIDLIMNGLR